MHDADVRVRYGARLSHWTKEGAIYSVTFRLADSLPREKREEIEEGRAQLKQKKSLSPYEIQRTHAIFSRKMEAYLNAGYGECWLRQENIAVLVVNALQQFQGERYELFAWCVMPNHVHVVVEPLEGWALAQILHSWKSFTAKKANKLLGRTKSFWQVEYYDPLVRDDQDLEHCVGYTYNNPDVAGLKDWRWKWKM